MKRPVESKIVNRRLNLLAWSILASVFLGMSVYLILNPTRTGVVPNYRLASTNWWAGLPIYVGGTHGFLYFPQFIVAFTPFNNLRPEILGEIVWRAFGFGLFTLALRLLSVSSLQFGASLPASRLPPFAFLSLVLLAVPASLASLNNGQTNLPLSACLVLAALALCGEKWNLAAILLSLAIVLKPIALASWLLAFAVFPSVRKPLWIGLLPLVAFGFAHPDFHYAWERWGKCLEKIVRSYTPENLRVSDLFGAMGKFGAYTPPMLGKGVRAGACLAALAYVWICHRRQGVPAGSWALWVASALVFTIFNPRAETNSYVLISPLLAYTAVSYWREVEGGKWKGVVLGIACIALMCDGMGLLIYKATDVWFKPLIVLLVSPLLFRVPEGWKEKSERR